MVGRFYRLVNILDMGRNIRSWDDPVRDLELYEYPAILRQATPGDGTKTDIGNGIERRGRIFGTDEFDGWVTAVEAKVVISPFSV